MAVAGDSGTGPLRLPRIDLPRAIHQRPEDRERGPKFPIWSWHHGCVTDQQARYDRIADGYATWWAPVHRPATLQLVDLLGELPRTASRRLLDVGCGTGAFAAAVAHAWPGTQVDAVDVSAGMLEVARRELAGLPADIRRRIHLNQAPGDALPFPDGTFDVVASAFVIQLVPSRFRALREMRRVLRPGGRLAIAAWLRAEEPFPADEAYDAALLAAGEVPRSGGGDHDDVASASELEAVLRRAGFSRPKARIDALVHAFTPESYLEFLARFDDEDLLSSMQPEARASLEADLLARLRALGPAGLRMVLPTVFAAAVRR